MVVDFWATWCGPCLAKLPDVKKVYAEDHAKGLEIVGVSCDGADAVLNKFTADNNMPWVQLRETSQTDEDHWSPIALRLNVTAIPAMFIIDRKGILREVDAGEDTEKKVDAILNEKN